VEDERSSSPLADLLALDGVELIQSSSIRGVACPFCHSKEVALFSGRVSIVATMSGSPFAGSTLSCFVCPDSHLFFLREEDALLRHIRAST
jgi:hypothetical protein